MHSTLTVEHRNRCLQFAQYHVHRHHHDIKGVLWTDDFIFCLDCNDGEISRNIEKEKQVILGLLRY